MLFLIFGIPLIIIIGVFILAILAIMKIGSSRQERHIRSQETQITQELHQGFMKMEKRVEALETILLDRERVRSKSD